MKNALEIILTEKKEIDFFKNNNVMNDILKDIENEVMSVVPCVDTATGRKEIASLANKVAKSKVAIDNSGKKLVSEWKEKSKLIDASRKQTRDFLDDLKTRVRKPLTDWENKEKERIEIERIKNEIELDFIEAIEINALFDREQYLLKKEAEILAKEAEIERIKQKEIMEIEKIEHEKELKKKAEHEAKIYAELKAKEKIDNALRLKAEAIAETERLKREAIEAKNKAIEDEKQLELDRLQAIEDARIEKETALKEAELKAKLKAENLERKRIEEEKEKKLKEKLLSENLKHRAKINNEALNSFVESGIEIEDAKNIITIIAKGKINHIIINY